MWSDGAEGSRAAARISRSRLEHGTNALRRPGVVRDGSGYFVRYRMRKRAFGYPLLVEIIGILILVGVIAYVLYKKWGQRRPSERD